MNTNTGDSGSSSTAGSTGTVYSRMSTNTMGSTRGTRFSSSSIYSNSRYGYSSSTAGSTATGSSGMSSNTHGSTSGSRDNGGGRPSSAYRHYLEQEYLWYKVEEILAFPDFCCFLSVLANYADYSKRQGGRVSGQRLEKEALDKFLVGVVEMPAASKNRTEQAIMEDLDMAFSQESYYGGEDLGQCYGRTGLYLLKCLLTEKLHEGIDACYCEYRANMGCSYMKDCGKDIYYDLKYASKHDPYFACFQCPQQKDYHDNWGQPSYLSGHS